MLDRRLDALDPGDFRRWRSPAVTALQFGLPDRPRGLAPKRHPGLAGET